MTRTIFRYSVTRCSLGSELWSEIWDVFKPELVGTWRNPEEMPLRGQVTDDSGELLKQIEARFGSHAAAAGYVQRMAVYSCKACKKDPAHLPYFCEHVKEEKVVDKE